MVGLVGVVSGWCQGDLGGMGGLKKANGPKNNNKNNKYFVTHLMTSSIVAIH